MCRGERVIVRYAGPIFCFYQPQRRRIRRRQRPVGHLGRVGPTLLKPSNRSNNRVSQRQILGLPCQKRFYRLPKQNSIHATI